MLYKEYNEIDKTFVLIHIEGCGEQGGHMTRKGIVGAFDTEEEAIKRGKELFPKDPSGWTYNNFDIDVNTATEKGKELLKEFEKKVGQLIKSNQDEFMSYEIDNHTITLKYNEQLDGKRKT